jgi:integrase
MPRRPEIGNVQLYPNRPLRESDKNGYVLRFYCPIRRQRIRRNCGTRDRREARRIMRECQERLINGAYVSSGGAITDQHELRNPRGVPVQTEPGADTTKLSWDEAYDLYRQNRSTRVRPGSLVHALSRLDLAARIFAGQREDAGLSPGFLIQEVMTLCQLESLQDRLLAGDEGRYDSRSPNSVNSTMGAVMAFVNFCHRRGWIPGVPSIQKLDADDAMRGRPISDEEFQRMLDAAPEVVGADVAPSWQFTLKLIWESGFRIADVVDFCWHDQRHIRPIWSNSPAVHPTIGIPATQKNGRSQEIPMLPGLRDLLETVPMPERNGWIANPYPIQQIVRKDASWMRPNKADLRMLAQQYSNRAIGRACGVTDTTVRTWLAQDGTRRSSEFCRPSADVPDDIADEIRQRGVAIRRRSPGASTTRLGKDRVSRIISKIGETAGIVVVQEDERTGKRRKYASAHDIRRGFAQRLINAGVSAETLKVVMRHRDFTTTEKHYGAIRSAQAAAAEVHQKLNAGARTDAFVGGLMGGNEKAQPLVRAELNVLKSLVERL